MNSNYLLLSIYQHQSKVNQYYYERFSFNICSSPSYQFIIGQKPNGQIEIVPYLRFDKYPPFTYSINSISTNEVNIQGTSWGINAFYKKSVQKNLYVKAGLGYYRYSFNKIENINSRFGKGNSRVINFPSTVDLIYITDKYWYNTISLNIGIEKMIPLRNDFSLAGGLNLNNYFTFSQYYHVTNAPTDIQSKDYRLPNNRYFGFAASINAALTKKVGKISIGPSIILPVFDLWKLDKMFPQEENSMSRNKWLNGFGIGITCSYSVSKK